MTIYPVDDDPYLATVGDRMRASERSDLTHLSPVCRDLRAEEYVMRKTGYAISGLVFARGLVAVLIVAAVVVAVALY